MVRYKILWGVGISVLSMMVPVSATIKYFNSEHVELTIMDYERNSQVELFTAGQFFDQKLIPLQVVVRNKSDTDLIITPQSVMQVDKKLVFELFKTPVMGNVLLWTVLGGWALTLSTIIGAAQQSSMYGVFTAAVGGLLVFRAYRNSCLKNTQIHDMLEHQFLYATRRIKPGETCDVIIILDRKDIWDQIHFSVFDDTGASVVSHKLPVEFRLIDMGNYSFVWHGRLEP